jgi:hypothetical protein
VSWLTEKTKLQVAEAVARFKPREATKIDALLEAALKLGYFIELNGGDREALTNTVIELPAPIFESAKLGVSANYRDYSAAGMSMPANEFRLNGILFRSQRR